jgi:hypothetical protein
MSVTSDDFRQPVSPAGNGSRPASRLPGALLSLLVGAIYGTVGTVAHQNVLRLGEAAIPVGLVFALIGSLGLLVGFRLLFNDRVPVLFAAIGMVGMIALFSVASAGGSILIPQGVAGLVWTVAPVLVATVVIAWPRIPQRPAATTNRNPSTAPANLRRLPEA